MECYRSDVEDTAYGAPDGTVILKGPKWPPLFRITMLVELRNQNTSAFPRPTNDRWRYEPDLAVSIP